MELILSMRKQGWLWTEEFIWHKKNCYPGKWPNRFRDAWERLLQFNKNEDFNKSYTLMINKFTKKFSNDFCTDDGEIDWIKLVEFNSKKD